MKRILFEILICTLIMTALGLIGFSITSLIVKFPLPLLTNNLVFFASGIIIGVVYLVVMNHIYLINDKIPNYETPEQYEKRTGEKFPDNRLVWYKTEDDIKNGYRWKDWTYGYAKDIKAKYIVVAEPPIEPPLEWEPKETV